MYCSRWHLSGSCPSRSPSCPIVFMVIYAHTQKAWKAWDLHGLRLTAEAVICTLFYVQDFSGINLLCIASGILFLWWGGLANVRKFLFFLGCLRRCTETAFTFCRTCCLQYRLISEAVKPKNISSDAQMWGRSWWTCGDQKCLLTWILSSLCFSLYICVIHFCSLSL